MRPDSLLVLATRDEVLQFCGRFVGPVWDEVRAAYPTKAGILVPEQVESALHMEVVFKRLPLKKFMWVYGLDCGW